MLKVTVLLLFSGGADSLSGALLAHSEGRAPILASHWDFSITSGVQNRLVDTCLQVFGGAGYLEETPVARAFRDARLQRIGGGTDEIMNEVIAKRLIGS